MRTARILLITLILPALSTCAQSRQEDPALAKYFKQAGYEGSFVLYDLRRDQYTHHNRDRNKTGFLPASTFKVMNSLIALETGVAGDANFELPWDGKKRIFDFWNRKHNLRSAIRYSVVWYYQELARRIGKERMGAWLKKTGYGNGDISAGVDVFWLQGDFRVTPLQQIQLLTRLHKGTLPFSRRSMDIVKGIMVVKKTNQHTVRGKTGLSIRGKKALGWWIGYVEKKDNVYFFATCIEAPRSEKSFIAARKKITNDILMHLGVLPAPGK